MRGNRLVSIIHSPICGSIPAHAGEPSAPHIVSTHSRVYPRTCGGTRMAAYYNEHDPGLSPHMRGNHMENHNGSQLAGSIPAHAGEPPNRLPRVHCMRVYPRTCGGTSSRAQPPSPALGLSPHMRGNHGHAFAGRIAMGSIPAHAGEPISPFFIENSFMGLSPHMRGNLYIFDIRMPLRGSIPAHAGEPDHPAARSLWHGVYPRTCGGTKWALDGLSVGWGLSPHMRGNHAGRARCGNAGGSIPAHAGEPPMWDRLGLHCGVYPRTCGGTRICLDIVGTSVGLSPHMRGNLSIITR